MSADLPDPSSIVAVEVPETAGTVQLTMSFIDAIGVYKLALGFGDDDEDVARVRAGLHVQLQPIVDG